MYWTNKCPRNSLRQPNAKGSFGSLFENTLTTTKTTPIPSFCLAIPFTQYQNKLLEDNFSRIYSSGRNQSWRVKALISLILTVVKRLSQVFDVVVGQNKQVEDDCIRFYFCCRVKPLIALKRLTQVFDVVAGPVECSGVELETDDGEDDDGEEKQKSNVDERTDGLADGAHHDLKT